MKWFDSDYDYIDEFTTQWNERYKKAKRMSIILSFQKRYSQRFKLSQPLA